MASALKFSVDLRTARVGIIEATVGAAAVLRIRSGTIPTDCASSDSGGSVVLATISLPASWLAAASAGAVAIDGTASWVDTSADAAGTAAYFRIYATAGDAFSAIQGTAGLTGDTPDMVLDSVNFSTGQNFSISAFTLTDGNA